MPCEAKELIKVQRKGCFVPYMSKWCETPEIYWSVSTELVEKAKQLAPGWQKDAYEVATILAAAVKTKGLTQALADLHQSQLTRDPKQAVYLDRDVQFCPRGSCLQQVEVTIKVVPEGFEIHPRATIAT